MTLEEKGLAFTNIEENLTDFSPTLLELHPEERVPLLIHDTETGQVVLYESSIITEYLEDTFPEPPLMPRDSALKAQVRLWTYWCNQIFKPDLDRAKYELQSLPEDAAKALLSSMHGHLKKLDQSLGKSPYLVGKDLTLADIHAFPFYRQLTRIRPEIPGLGDYPHLNNWLEQITQRPTFERVMKKPAV